MNKSSTFSIRYASLHAVYQASSTLVIGYSSVYLLSRGYSDALIGIILAISNTIAAVLQPAIGSLLDRKKNISLQIFSACMQFIMVALAVILLVTHMGQLPLSILVILIFSLEFSIQPLVNSLCFLLESMGISINFGLCRGIGSMTYAVLAAILGKLIAVFDASLLPIFYIAVFAAMGICFLSLRTKSLSLSAVTSADNAEALDHAHNDTEIETSLSLLEFVRTYKRFMLFLAGSCLIYFMFFAAGNYYVIQIVSPIGGDTTEMGIAMALAAAIELPFMGLFNKLNKRFSLQTLLRVSGIFFVIKYFLILIAGNIPLFYVAQLFQAGSYAIYYPASASYTSRLLPQADLVKGQSLLTCMYTVSGIFASLIGGMLINYVSVHAMLLLLFFCSVAGAVILWFSVEKVH